MLITPTDQSDILAVFVEQNDKWIQKEENLNDSDNDVEAYERVLFSRTTVFTGDITVMTVTKELYPKCSDFGTLYKYLQDRLNQPSDAENETPTRETNKRKRQLFNMTDVKGNHVHRDSNGTPIQWGQNGPCTDTRFGTTKQKRVRFSDRPTITKQYTCSDGTIIDLSKLLQRFDVGQYLLSPS